MASLIELVRSAYCFSFFNEKASNCLTQGISFKSYRHSDIIVEYLSKINKLLIVKNGSIRIQGFKPKQIKQEETGKLKDRVDQYLVKHPRVVTDFVDLCEFGPGEVICEEYFYKKTSPCNYQAVVSSAEALIAEIPFDLVSTTLAAFEMYIDPMKEAITTRHKLKQRVQNESSKTEYENKEKKEKRREDLKSAHLERAIKPKSLHINHLIK